MTDPTFETRETLFQWAAKEARDAAVHSHWFGKRTAQLDALERIRRVTAAHQHLMETPDVDAQ